MATLLLELALTRLFSVLLFYHFAFMAISVALFGLGVGGVLSYCLGAARSPESFWRRTGAASTVNLVVTALVLAAALRISVAPAVTGRNVLKLAVLYFLSAVPFLLTGVVLSQVIARTVARIHRVYLADLLGAGAGCLLLVPLLDALGGPNTVLAAAVLFGVAGAVWFEVGAAPGRVRLALALAAVLALFILGNGRFRWLDVRYAKGNLLYGELYTRWNSFSRVAVRDKGAGWLEIVIDADASTSISDFSPETATPAERDKLLNVGPGMPYLLRPAAKTLIIGPGGGPDVVRALASGSQDVTGVEINPIIVNDIMRGRFAGQSRLYFRPEVRIRIDEGRHFVRHSPDRYQVIQMTLVDTWASTAAGAFALSENNLYTTEAFLDYLTHLTDDGMLAITRWEFEPPRESLRVVSLGREALTRLGAADPAAHFLVIRERGNQIAGYGAVDTVLIKRRPWTPEEIALGGRAVATPGLEPLYVPGERIPNPFTEFLLATDPAAFARGYRFDITPVPDDRPFFFYTARTADLWSIARGSTEDAKINLGVMMLLILLATSLVATAVILLLPRWVLGARVPREPGVFLHLSYFVAIGLGFIMVEVGLIQKFLLFLGRPVFALTVVVFALLISSGLGSYSSERLIGRDERRLAGTLVAVALLVAALMALLPLIFRAADGWPLFLRCALSCVLLFPAGFLMGMPFPCGLQRLERRHPGAVRWAWSVNSAASVLGSVAAIFFAIQWGLAATVILGGGAYLLALVSLRLTRAPAPELNPVAEVAAR
jgi:hypothetical protein